MPHPVFFAHANGFPSATYGKLFSALDAAYPLHYLPLHGHDPRFPVRDNWAELVDELLHHVSALDSPVWGVGHSLGGALHYYAALRRPELYRGVIMLDSPVLNRAERAVVRLAKRVGLIDHLTPAKRTAGRREHFDDHSQAREYFAGKHLFSGFDPQCFDDYVEHALTPSEAGLRLRFDPTIEMRIYRSVPHTAGAQPATMPVALIRGSSSRVVRPFHARMMKRLRYGEFHEVAGGHMFPLEQPQATAQLISHTLQRWAREFAQ